MTFTDEELDFIIKHEPSEVTSALARELKAMRIRLPSIEKEYRELLDTHTVYVVEAAKDYVSLVEQVDEARAQYRELLDTYTEYVVETY